MHPTKELKIDKKLYKDAARIFKILSDKTKLKIIDLLDENGKLRLNAISSKMRKDPLKVSHHIRGLEKAGFVSSQKKVTQKQDFYLRNKSNDEQIIYTTDPEYKTITGVMYHSREKYYSINYSKFDDVHNIAEKLSSFIP